MTETPAAAPRDLTFADLASVPDVSRVEPVDVPEWGGRVYVKTLTALEQDRLDMSRYGPDATEPDFSDNRVRMVAHCLCDAAGRPLLPDRAPSHLAGKDPRVIGRLYRKVLELNDREDPGAGKDDSAAAPGGS